jgi:flagella basal body P-ring formation protein FlgA
MIRYLSTFTIFTIYIYALSNFSIEEEIKEYLQNRFTTHYPTMNIKHITITTAQKIPKGSKIVQISLKNNSLKRESGNFSVILKTSTKQQRVYFKYLIDAQVTILKTNSDIKKSTPLTLSLFDRVPIKFTNFYAEPLLKVNGLEAKTNIPTGKYLIKRLTKPIPLIHKQDRIIATIKDSGIELNLPVVALEDGVIGEVVRVKRESGKIFKAVIISSKVVSIQ